MILNCLKGLRTPYNDFTPKRSKKSFSEQIHTVWVDFCECLSPSEGNTDGRMIGGWERVGKHRKHGRLASKHLATFSSYLYNTYLLYLVGNIGKYPAGD